MRRNITKSSKIMDKFDMFDELYLKLELLLNEMVTWRKQHEQKYSRLYNKDSIEHPQAHQ